MHGLFKFNRLTFGSDAISDCAKNLKDLQKLKLTYPPEKEQVNALCINLKA
jgi:hypothetical protein